VDLDVFTIPDPTSTFLASDVKDVAEEVITPLPFAGCRGSSLDPGHDIWLVVILACTNQNSIWGQFGDNDTVGTPLTQTLS